MIDFDKLAEDLSSVNETEASRLSQLADKMAKLQQYVENCEQALKDAQADLRNVVEKEIPALMTEMGMSSFTLNNGLKVVVSNYYSGSINKEVQDQAFAWLVNKGFGDIIKNDVITVFSMRENEKAQEFAKDCWERGLDAEVKKKVEPSTMKAFVREQTEKGNALPSELFNVYIGQRASIKKG